MSTSFRPLSPLRIDDIFSGCLERHGIREHALPRQTPSERCLTDGQNYLLIHADENGLITTMSRGHLCHIAEAIVVRISREFDVEIVNSAHPRYFGFENQDEMETFSEKMAKESGEEFYAQLMAYLRGEPHGIAAGTVGAAYARLASELVKQEPTLLEPANKDIFMERLEATYNEKEAITVTLTNEEMAEAVRIGVERTKAMNPDR